MDKLQTYRKAINHIDKELLKLFKKRLDVVKKVGEYKKENNLLVIDKKREKELLTYLEQEAEKLGLRKELVKKIWPIIFKEAYTIEQ